MKASEMQDKLQRLLDYQEMIQIRNAKGYYSPAEYAALWNDVLARINAVMGLE